MVYTTFISHVQSWRASPILWDFRLVTDTDAWFSGTEIVHWHPNLFMTQKIYSMEGLRLATLKSGLEIKRMALAKDVACEM